MSLIKLAKSSNEKWTKKELKRSGKYMPAIVGGLTGLGGLAAYTLLKHANAIESGLRTDLPNAWKVKKGMGPNSNIPIAKGLFKQSSWNGLDQAEYDLYLKEQNKNHSTKLLNQFKKESGIDNKDTFDRYVDKNMSNYTNKDRTYIAKKMRKGYDIGGVGSALGVGGLTYLATKKTARLGLTPSRRLGLSGILGMGALIPGAVIGSSYMLSKHINKLNKSKLEKTALEIPVSHLKGDAKEINTIRALAKKIIKITHEMNAEDNKAMK